MQCKHLTHCISYLAPFCCTQQLSYVSLGFILRDCLLLVELEDNMGCQGLHPVGYLKIKFFTHCTLCLAHSSVLYMLISMCPCALISMCTGSRKAHFFLFPGILVKIIDLNLRISFWIPGSWNCHWSLSTFLLQLQGICTQTCWCEFDGGFADLPVVLLYFQLGFWPGPHIWLWYPHI